MTPDVFRAVADPTRRAILDLLAEGELPVKEIQPALLRPPQPSARKLGRRRRGGNMSEAEDRGSLGMLHARILSRSSAAGTQVGTTAKHATVDEYIDPGATPRGRREGARGD